MRKIKVSDILKTLNVFNSLLFSAFRFSQMPYTIYDFTKKKGPTEETDSSCNSTEMISQSKCFLLLDIQTDSQRYQFLNKMYRIILEDISFYKNFRLVLKNNFIQKKNFMGNLNLINQK